jgi:hypothetical protein
LRAEKVFGVVTGPSYCGCEPAEFRWVTEKELEAGRTDPRICLECGAGIGLSHTVFRQYDVIDVCGEADVAEAVFAAEFADKLAAIT